MTWCVCVMHLRFSKPMDKCTPRTRRITWWPVCRQKWPWNWTPSPSILCIQEPTLHCREWHRCSDLQGRTPHHAISFDFAARYDGRWMSSNHFFIKLTISQWTAVGWHELKDGIPTTNGFYRGLINHQKLQRLPPQMGWFLPHLPVPLLPHVQHLQGGDAQWCFLVYNPH